MQADPLAQFARKPARMEINCFRCFPLLISRCLPSVITASRTKFLFIKAHGLCRTSIWITKATRQKREPRGVSRCCAVHRPLTIACLFRVATFNFSRPGCPASMQKRSAYRIYTGTIVRGRELSEDFPRNSCNVRTRTVKA